MKLNLFTAKQANKQRGQCTAEGHVKFCAHDAKGNSSQADGSQSKCPEWPADCDRDSTRWSCTCPAHPARCGSMAGPRSPQSRLRRGTERQRDGKRGRINRGLSVCPEGCLLLLLTDVLHARPLGNCHGLVRIEHPGQKLRPIKCHRQGAANDRQRVKLGIHQLGRCSPDFDEDARRYHNNVIKRHQIRHGQRHRVEGRGKEATTGGGHIHHQHHANGRNAECIEGGAQARNPIADDHEQQRLDNHAGQLPMQD